MPEVEGWVYGMDVWVVKQLDRSQRGVKGIVLDDQQPEVGTRGRVMTINTTNGKADTIGVMFEDRAWVYPVDHLCRYRPLIDGEVEAAIASITGGVRDEGAKVQGR